MGCLSFLKNIWALRPIYMTVICILLSLVFVIYYSDVMSEIPEKAARCLYVIVFMALMWLTEAIPIPATALMPIFLFPMLEVASAKTISGSYVTDTTMLFLGGLIIAVALEESGLHIRISLLVMRIMGAQPNLLMLGLMLTTWFLSMWISNTAATTMMIPIIQAVITTMERINEGGSEEAHTNVAFEMDKIPDVYIPGEPQHSGSKYDMREKKDELDDEDVMVDETKRMTPHQMSLLAKGFSLCVAYGANIGGIATLTGTPPNLVLKEVADELYANFSGGTQDSGIEFAKWMGFAFPMSLVFLIIAWAWLQILFLRGRCFTRLDNVAKRAVNRTILKQYRALGPVSMCEIEILIVFILLIVLWLSRNPPEREGWGSLFTTATVSDSTPCILLGVLLFILPAKVPEVFSNAPDYDNPSYRPILTWQAVSKKLPWGVIVLLGGGFAIAKASTESGFSNWMGEQLKVFQDFSDPVVNLIICAVVASATEVTSNTATAQLLMPILARLALAIDVHPLYLMMSTGIACSFAFMLPVATPPNALVFSTGYLSIADMFWAGIPMNCFGIGVLTLAINTWGKTMFDLDTVPDIFKNSTTLEDV